jgi:transcription initiation factor TFIIB
VKCPECQSEVVLNQGEQVCSKCGLVLSENHLINKPEWNFFTKDKLIHTGYSENINIHDKGLPTVIGGDKDIWGRSISAETKYSMFRIRRIQRQTIVGNERTLGMGLGLINLYSDKLDIPYSVRSRASLIFREISDKNLIRGRSIINIAVASVYYACREEKVIRDLNTVEKSTGLKRKDIACNYRFLLKHITNNSPIEPFNFTKYITMIGGQLGISGTNQGAAIKLLNSIESKGRQLHGKDPKGLACAALYIACYDNERITQINLAHAADLTEVTIRNRTKHLKKILGMT